MNFIYKTATQQDIDILVTTRIEVLRAANKLADQVASQMTSLGLPTSTRVLALISDGMTCMRSARNWYAAILSSAGT